MKKHFLLFGLILCLALTALAACTRDPAEPPAESDTAAETWLCECGFGSAGNFCPECGTARPADETTDEATDGETTDEPTAEETTDGAAAEETTEKPAEETTEPETRAPRYDYFDAEVKADVTVDASVYTDMQFTLPTSLLVSEQDVKDYIDYILFQYRTAVNGTTQVTDQPMKPGDDAYIYYKGMIDGVAFEGGSNWDDDSPHKLGLGSGSFIPGFEAGLVGVIPANATKDNPAEVHVTFPEEYGAADLAGKDAIFYVAVEYAVQYTVPAYNRDTVENTLKYEGTKEVYVSDAAYLAEFEEYIRTSLESDKAAEVESAKLSALWNYLTEKAACRNLPQMELDYYRGVYIGEIEYYYNYYKSYGGSAFTEEYPTLDDFARVYLGLGKDGDWRAEIQKHAEDIVKKDMITHAIAELEGMETVSEEEFHTELQYWVDYYQGYMSKEDVLNEMGEGVIRSGALAEKVQTWLLEHSAFTYAD